MSSTKKTITIKVKKPKTITFKGEDIKYRSIKELSNKLKITETQSKKLIKDYKENNTVRYFIDKDGNVGRQNLKEKPLIAREFGVVRITNKNLLKDNYKTAKGITISNKIPKNRPVKLAITITVKIKFSKKYETRKFTVNVTSRWDNLNNDYYKSLVEDYYIVGEDDIIIDKVDVKSEKTDQKFDKTMMGLFRAKPLNISNLYNEVIDNKDGKCIQNYLGKIYSKFSKKEIATLKNTNDLYEYSVKHNIKMIAYDINGNVIKSHYPAQKNKSRKNLIYIAFDSHLYPIKNTLLNKVKPLNDYKINHCSDLKKKLISFLEEGILPLDIKLKADDIISFKVDDVCYLNNPDYEICKNILGKFALEDKLTITTNLTNMGDILEKLFIKENIDSFIPENQRFVKGGFNYHNDELHIQKLGVPLNNSRLRELLKKSNKTISEHEELEKLFKEERQEFKAIDWPFITIDKNKSYPSALHDLSFLIVTDYKCCNIKTKDIKKLVPHHLYIAKPKVSTILLPDENLYSGEHLIYCKKEGVDFQLKEELECDKKPNYYKELIDKLFRFTEEKYAKDILNIMIGKMERYLVNTEFNVFDQILGKGELETFTGFTQPLNDDYVIGLKPKLVNIIVNKKPINIQVKDRSRVVVYEMLKKLDIDDKKDLLQIKTDAITFLPKNNKYKKYINKDISGWKYEKYNCIKNRVPNTVSHSLILTSTDDNSYLGYQMAGGGKSYTIMNDIVPKLDKPYIIVSPSHVSIAEYRHLDYTCDVIQKYLYRKIIPNVETVIVDEVGMIGNAGWNIIYMCKILGKTIIAYGDFNQLKPVGSHRLFDKDHWLNLMFSTINKDWTNRRNNFTREYYLDLINEKVNLKKEVEKWSSVLDDTEYVLCWFNETRKKYNKMICDKKGIKSLTDIGALIMCKTNELRDADIYNNYVFKVQEINDNKVKLYNVDFKDTVELPIVAIEKYFDYAYARTLYNIQGQTLNSYYWCKEDTRALDGRSAYTIISRLKQ